MAGGGLGNTRGSPQTAHTSLPVHARAGLHRCAEGKFFFGQERDAQARQHSIDNVGGSVEGKLSIHAHVQLLTLLLEVQT